MTRHLHQAAWALACCLGTAAHGAAFTNGSFESFNAGGADVYCPGGISYCGQYNAGNPGVTGWTVGGVSVDVVGVVGWTAADGDWSIDLSGVGAGSLSQTFDTVAGTTYRVSFQIAGNFYDSGMKTGTASAGGTVLPLSFDTAGRGSTTMGWESRSFTFTAAGASSTLQFVSSVQSSAGLALDNVQVTAVPEPATALLWLAGIAGLAAAAGRQRRQR
jgi:choice-of-anchor C domain-containing protein